MTDNGRGVEGVKQIMPDEGLIFDRLKVGPIEIFDELRDSFGHFVFRVSENEFTVKEVGERWLFVLCEEVSDNGELYNRVTVKLKAHFALDAYLTDQFEGFLAKLEEMGQLRDSGAMTNHNKLKLWSKFINHQYAAWAALFELITGVKPPKLRDMLGMMSGH